MRVLTRKSALVGVLSATLLASACGGGDDDSGSEDSGATGGAATGTVTVNGCTPENPFIPSNTNETCGGDVLDALMAKLVKYNPDTAEPEFNIAEDISSEDNTTWTVTLKEGFTFADGSPVTANSFVDAWNWAAYGPNAQQNAYFFDFIQGYDEVQSGEDPDGDGPQEGAPPATETMTGLEVVSDTEFTITTKSPVSNVPIRLGYTAFSPLPESFFEDDGEAFGAAPVANGPFTFESYTEGSEIILKANPDYAGDNKAQVETLTFRIYQELEAAYVDLVAGNVDIVDVLPPSALAGDTYKSDLGDRVVEQASGVIQTFTFPAYVPAYENPALRRAVSQAIDRDTITQTVFNGSRIPATGFVSPVVDGYKEGQCGDLCTFDPEAAQASLQEAGGFSGVFEIAYNADGAHKEWVDAACVSITNTLGIQCQGKPYVDFATLRADVNARSMTGPFRTGWQMDYPSIENFLAPIYATDAGSNDGPYSNPAFDDLLTQAAAAEGDEANALYQEAELILVEDVPAVPLWYNKTVGGYSENVATVKFNPFGVPDWTTITVN